MGLGPVVTHEQHPRLLRSTDQQARAAEKTCYDLMDQCSTGTTSHQHYQPPHQPPGHDLVIDLNRPGSTAVLTGSRLGQQHASRDSCCSPIRDVAGGRYWIEPVTSSVSGQNLCLGMRAGVASAACGRSPDVGHCAGWLADSLADSEQVAAPGRCMRAYPRPALCGFLWRHFGRRSMCGFMNSGAARRRRDPAQPRIEFEKHATEHCFSAVGWKPGHARSLDEPLAATTR